MIGSTLYAPCTLNAAASQRACQYVSTTVPSLKYVISTLCTTYSQARSQGGGGGGGGGGRPPPPPKKKKRESNKKKNKVACMHVKLPPFNHFQSKIKYKFVLYEENTGHMHQIAPLTTSKCKKLSLWGVPPSHPPPPLARSAPSHVIFYRPPKIKSWLSKPLLTPSERRPFASSNKMGQYRLTFFVYTRFLTLEGGKMNIFLWGNCEISHS